MGEARERAGSIDQSESDGLYRIGNGTAAGEETARKGTETTGTAGSGVAPLSELWETVEFEGMGAEATANVGGTGLLKASSGSLPKQVHGKPIHPAG